MNKEPIVSNRIKISTIFFLLILQNILLAGITVSSKIDTTIATVGDQITLNISVQYQDKNTHISFPNLNDELQKFSVISTNSTDPEKISKGFLKNYQFKIAIFDTGKIKIPPLTVTTQRDTLEKLTFQTSPHIVNVISVLPPDQNVKPKDIKQPFPLPTILPWDIIIFIAIILLIITWWYLWYKKWKKQHPKVDFNEKYLDPPHIIALRKLDNIKNMPFSTEEDIIKCYTEISYIFREYMENRFFVPALEMPTREIMETTSSLDIQQRTALQIQDILTKLDIIKFANQLPEKSEKEKILTIAKQIINDIKVDNFLSQRSGLTEIKEKLVVNTQNQKT